MNAKFFINLLYAFAFLAAVEGIAVAEETRVVHRNDGRSGYHAKRVTIEGPTTMATYPGNVQVVVKVVDQKVGSSTGSRGRSGYNHALHAID